jgi:hypothetical protein
VISLPHGVVGRAVEINKDFLLGAEIVVELFDLRRELWAKVGDGMKG